MPPTSSKAWLKVPDWICLLVANPLRRPPPVVAAGGGGSPQRLLQSLATETLGVPVLYHYAFLPQSILGPNSNSTVTLAFLSEVERLVGAIYGYIDEIIMTSPGHWGRGAYNELLITILIN